MSNVAEIMSLGWQHYQAGNFVQAEQLFRQVVQAEPSHAGAYNCLAVILVQQGKLGDAASSLQEALRSQPDNGEIHNNLGSVLVRLGRTAEAVDHYRRATRLKPDYVEAHYNLGLALKSLGQRDDAVAAFQEALRLQPNFAQALHDLGTALAELGKLNEAESHYRQALSLAPARAETHHNLGCVLQNLDRLDEAIACYREALRLNPNFARAHYNLGTAHHGQGRLDEAAAAYRRAVSLQPHAFEAQSNLGLVLHEQGKLDEAVACHRLALKSNPQSAPVHINLAGALREKGELLEAIDCYRQAVQLEPTNPAVLAELVHQLQHVCLWKQLDELSRKVVEAIDKNTARGRADAVSPFTFLALPTPTTSEQHFHCARQWAQHRFQARNPPTYAAPLAPGPSPLIIGYLSADFHEHATAYLIAELIEKHDRQRFHIFGYSYGPDDGSPMRQRLTKAFDRFRDIKNVSFQQAAQQIQADKVDILVDLKGYTRHARTQIMALRPAPIQVNYLGYPGTMGAPFIDYILVDDFVVPPDQQPFFTEKLVHLPGCYQVNDSQRPIASNTPSRAACGLHLPLNPPPSAGEGKEGGRRRSFVFCCFNNSYKITPDMFSVWMRLLKAVPGSVLWLLEDNRFAPDNLRTEALDRGIAPERLVFAPHLGLAEHLARHCLADLFLDTFPYNAHTTASDALWVGCPVVTMAGQTFPSRVAGSLLRIIGLPELITTNLEDYEKLALRLATDTDYLEGLRARLQANRKTSPLFNGERFARMLEEAFLRMCRS